MGGALRRVRRRLVRLPLGKRVSREAPRHVLGGRGPGDRVFAVRLLLAKRLGKEESLSRSARFRITVGTNAPRGTGSPCRVDDRGVGRWLDPRERGRGRRDRGGGSDGLAVRAMDIAGYRES